jgi:hypothetical protein
MAKLYWSDAMFLITGQSMAVSIDLKNQWPETVIIKIRPNFNQHLP